MNTTVVKNITDFLNHTYNDTNTNRDHIATEIEAFAELVASRAETLSLIDFCYWRKAIEDVLARGQRHLYERYETDKSARQEATNGHRSA